MAVTLQQAVENERLNQAISQQNNPLVALFQGIGAGVEERMAEEQKAKQEKSELEKLFKIEEFKSELKKQQDILDFEQAKELQRIQENQTRLQKEQDRKANIQLELAKAGVTPTGDRRESGELSRITDDFNGAMAKRGVSDIEDGAMSLPGGEVGDVEGNVIPRREERVIPRASDRS